jgi:hypothetical protein
MVSDQLHVPAALPSREAPVTHWTEACVSPRDGLDAVAKEKNPFPSLPGTKLWSSSS